MGCESKFYINEYIKYREHYNAMLQWTLLYQKTGLCLNISIISDMKKLRFMECLIWEIVWQGI